MFNETFKSKRATLVFIIGVMFLILGILGFFQDKILGLFAVNTTHNIIHIASGLFAIFYGAQNVYTAKNYGMILAAFYAIITVAGIIMGEGYLFGLVRMNHADHFLHLGFTLIHALIGFTPLTALSERQSTLRSS